MEIFRPGGLENRFWRPGGLECRATDLDCRAEIIDVCVSAPSSLGFGPTKMGWPGIHFSNYSVGR